jgi:anti-sigma factor RsiW
MDYEVQLKLQAFLDGELPETEARDVANLLARDRDAAALMSELRQTRQTVMGFESGVRLPESREFYWSKIQRDIERLDTPAIEPVRVPLFVRLRRFLLPAGALAALVAAGLFVGPGHKAFPLAEMAVADTEAFIYHDYAAGETFIWLSYPAENELADSGPDDIMDP